MQVGDQIWEQVDKHVRENRLQGSNDENGLIANVDLMALTASFVSHKYEKYEHGGFPLQQILLDLHE